MTGLHWVFLLDVDNTLIDNDAVKADLDRQLKTAFGPEVEEVFWRAYDAVRHDLERVDYPEVLRRLYAGLEPGPIAERVTAMVNTIPYERYRYPGALETLAHLSSLGTTVILSDGDPEYQPAKIRRAGLTDAVGGRVIITTHKEAELGAVQRRYPADRYVMIDDKPGILAAIKQREPARFRTIMVAQGHYAQTLTDTIAPPPDLTVAHIGDLQQLTLVALERPADG